VKLAVVVQRYGAEISGGAELHARYIAEHLAKHAEVEVLTTCARDYIAWRNEFPSGPDQVNGVAVRRFPVSRERNVKVFARRSEQVFHHTHSLADELAWIESEGPTSPALVSYIRASLAQYDFFVFFSYRYYHAYHGIRAAAPRAVLVPTAERDPAIGLQVFPPLFRGVRALMFNSFEERDLICAVSGVGDLPGVVVGVGSEVPADTNPQRFRGKYGIKGRFAVYVGRIDENKGCKDLFRHFERYARVTPGGLSLVLVGAPILQVPDHPRVRHLGFLPDQDKFDAIAASDVLIMPSYLESLSMVALEAWALGRPVLANARCDVLKGQCLRSNAGLYYENGAEFAEALRWIASTSPLARELGANGRAYYHRHYRWPVVERRYLETLDQLSREPDDRAVRGSRLEPLPGWLARRQKKIPAAAEVVAQLPRGPSRRGDRGRRTEKE
jgi:glycosyltransferase involved in cell wall biosynthesis